MNPRAATIFKTITQFGGCFFFFFFSHGDSEKKTGDATRTDGTKASTARALLQPGAAAMTRLRRCGGEEEDDDTSVCPRYATNCWRGEISLEEVERTERRSGMTYFLSARLLPPAQHHTSPGVLYVSFSRSFHMFLRIVVT